MGDSRMCGELLVAFTSAYKLQKDLWLLASYSGLIDIRLQKDLWLCISE